MTLSLQQISDRLEIQDLLVDYSHAIDTRDFNALDDVFTADAHVDYSEMGGSAGSLAETKAFLEDAMKNFASFQHMVATSKVVFASAASAAAAGPAAAAIMPPAAGSMP